MMQLMQRYWHTHRMKRKVRRAMIRMRENYHAPKLGASHDHGRAHRGELARTVEPVASHTGQHDGADIGAEDARGAAK